MRCISRAHEQRSATVAARADLRAVPTQVERRAIRDRGLRRFGVFLIEDNGRRYRCQPAPLKNARFDGCGYGRHY
jgi:hypothetical protein